MVWRLPGRRVRFTILIIFMLATLLSWLYLDRLVQISSDAVVRWEVWNISLLALREHVWFGLGDKLDVYLSNNGIIGISHAHNFFLDQAVRFGVAGLVSSLWLCSGLLYLAAKRSGTIGLLAVGLVVFMNFIDTSLFYVGVFLPVILTLRSRQG